eukprot:12517-Heterococcus_DN1.PRE.1
MRSNSRGWKLWWRQQHTTSRNSLKAELFQVNLTSLLASDINRICKQQHAESSDPSFLSRVGQ